MRRGFLFPFQHFSRLEVKADEEGTEVIPGGDRGIKTITLDPPPPYALEFKLVEPTGVRTDITVGFQPDS